MIVLPKTALKAAVIACAKEGNGRASMQCIHVMEGHERFQLEATDGRLLAIIRGPIGGQGYEEVTTVLGETDYLVNAKELKAALADGHKKVEHCALRCDRSATSVIVSTAPTAQCEVAQGEGRFPDVASVTRGIRGMLSISLDPRLLKQLCEVAIALFAGTDNAETPRIRLLLQSRSDELPMAFFVENGEVKCEGLLMPLT